MYREPHLNVKSSECSKLWYEWFELFDNMETRNTEECKNLREKWSKCCSEFGKLIQHENETNPRYRNLNGYRSSVKD